MYFIVCIAKANAQNIDTSLINRKLAKPIIEEDTSITRFRTYCSSLRRYQEPLWLFNDKKVNNFFFENHFLNKSQLKISVITDNDSLKHFGKKGSNGVIVLKTENPIYWKTNKQIIKEKFPVTFDYNEKVLFEIDNTKQYFDDIRYFANNFIESINAIECNEYFEGVLYRKKIIIKSTNPPSTNQK